MKIGKFQPPSKSIPLDQSKKCAQLITSRRTPDIKFGTQLGFGEYVTVTTLVPNLAGVGWATGAPQKLCGSGTMY